MLGDLLELAHAKISSDEQLNETFSELYLKDSGDDENDIAARLRRCSNTLYDCRFALCVLSDVLDIDICTIFVPKNEKEINIFRGKPKHSNHGRNAHVFLVDMPNKKCGVVIPKDSTISI